MSGRTAKKVSGPSSWQPPEGVKFPRLTVTELDHSVAFQGGMKIVARESDRETSAAKKKRRDAEHILQRLICIPGGANQLAADLARHQGRIGGFLSRIAICEAEGKPVPSEWRELITRSENAMARDKELLQLLPADAVRDLNGERRQLQGEIQRLENRIATLGRNAPDELVEQRVKLEDRLAELATLIDQRDILREPLQKLHAEAVRGAIAALCTSLENMVIAKSKDIRRILFANAPVYRLVPSRIPSTIDAPYRVVLEADELCRRLTGRPASLWRSVFRGLDAALQHALASRLGVRLGRPEPESGSVEADEPADELAEINRLGARAS